MESKKRWSNGFLGSVIFHTLLFVFVSVFAAFSIDNVAAKDDFIEVDYFAGTGGGGGGGGGGDKPITHSVLEDRVQGSGDSPDNAEKAQRTETDAIVDKSKASDEPKNTGGKKEESKAIYPGADKGPNTGTGGGYGSGTGTGIGSGTGTGSGSGSGGGHGSGTGTGIGSGSGAGTGGNLDQRIAVNARLLSAGSIVYPESAKTLAAGTRTAVIMISVDDKGKVANVELTSSTGNADLDNAAVRYGYTHKFTPARNAQGVGVKTKHRKSVNFALKG